IQPIPIHLASPSYTSRMRRTDVIGHRIRARVVTVGGLPVESLEDCFVHVASLLDHDELVAVGDAIVARTRRDRLEIADLVRNAEHFRGARGMSRVGRALGAVRVGSESPQETRTRLLLVRAGIREPELQIEVAADDGTLIGRLDMGWRELRLGVEYDGQHHRTDARQYAWDIERHRRLQEAGWEVIRVTAPDLADGARRMIAIIRAAIARRAR
ncbi:endonuclease domain-containing protein, partial [Burkholderia cenocepacia]|uniref:endonuclease domain-containing protein n=1 Tax=Burkholderia cenocepacia TaxID=95486 RepID=UPI0038CC01B8